MKLWIKLFFGLVVLSIIVIFGIKLVLPLLEEKDQFDTSDAADMKSKARVAVDGWVGYSVLVSSRMRSETRNNSFALIIEDDGADNEGRLKKFANGYYDFIVATIDSYVLNAAPEHFPGKIVGVLDVSFGGDAVLAYEDEIPNLEALKTKSVKIAYTPRSPSHHLLKASSSDFDIPNLLKNPSMCVETNGSSEAFKLFKDRKVSVAALWEPEVSKALAIPGVVKLISTKDAPRLIVDVLMAHHDFIKEHPGEIDLTLRSYFRTLKYYRENPDELVDDIRSRDKEVSKEQVKQMLDGVQFVNLTDNCESWFGIGQGGFYGDQGIITSINYTIEILRDSGDFSQNPLPDSDPYMITNRTFLEKIYNSTVQNGFIGSSAGAPRAALKFKELSDSAWNALREVGTLRVEPITFQSGTSMLGVEGKAQIDRIADRLNQYPAFRVLVKGHTNTRGDREANIKLSKERADAVARYLKITHGVDSNRIRAVGYGGEKPLPKKPNESDRAYRNRLPRVEVSLLQEVL